MNNDRKFITAGVLGVVIAGLIGVITGSVWSAFFIAILVAAIWLFFLDRNYISKLEPSKTKTSVRVLLILLIASQAYIGVIGVMKSAQQSENLVVVRTVFDEGTIQPGVEIPMVKSFRHFHTTPSDELTIEESFREVAGDWLGSDNRYVYEEGNWKDNFESVYEVVSPNEIRITTAAKIGMGEDPEFQNFNGDTGKYQSIATLTEGGISYVREN